MSDDGARASTEANGTTAPKPPAGGLPLDSTLEAVLITLDRPTPAAKLAEALSAGGADPIEPDAIEAAADRLNAQYTKWKRAFRIERVGGGLRLMTLPDFAPAIACVRKSRDSGRLSRAALETLAIVAYRQPATRAELEAIRGVACGEVLRSLLDRKLLMIKGRAEELGRPMLYGTTKHFLDQFGLASLKDLPPSAEPEGARGCPRAVAPAEDETPATSAEPELKPLRTGVVQPEG
ncbi:MAG: segregation and condensation protein B [Phycisphaeraceae bacterium]|nr:MAG: segregation and condensation protein B [Phycisphaeraceae bacterium]